ncbi:hypothetical protein NDU88_001162 [Pleurodeles waltl]|uniref:Uncharacterized protein n=1 Tax=Pleurodeles waltl TaxID=8319 RepID=A0AAV7TJB2_PLEWA|nr:hypothetical protein NDU88_001162 [Pleurodeles waltl]
MDGRAHTLLTRSLVVVRARARLQLTVRESLQPCKRKTEGTPKARAGSAAAPVVRTPRRQNYVVIQERDEAK